MATCFQDLVDSFSLSDGSFLCLYHFQIYCTDQGLGIAAFFSALARGETHSHNTFLSLSRSVTATFSVNPLPFRLIASTQPKMDGAAFGSIAFLLGLRRDYYTTEILENSRSGKISPPEKNLLVTTVSDTRQTRTVNGTRPRTREQANSESTRDG